MRPLVHFALGALFATPACSTEPLAQRAAGAAAQAAADASKSAQEAVDGATEKTRLQAEKAYDEAVEGTKQTAQGAWDQVADPGTLSDLTKAALAAATAEGSIEAIVSAGAQVIPMAADMSSAFGDIVDRDVSIEPIFQRVDDEAATKKVDDAIADMPRTEVIDGVTVGFEDLSSLDTKTHRSDAGYLVIWRRGDHLVGFVYRSSREIHLDKLVALAPKLMSAAQAATKDP